VARIVVLSRNHALPFALNSAGHEVVPVAEETDVRWSQYVAFADVVLLDVDDPEACQLLVNGVAESAVRPIRVLVVATTSAAWQAWRAESSAPGIALLWLPLTMPRLEDALTSLMAGPELQATSDTSVRDPAPAPAPASDDPAESRVAPPSEEGQEGTDQPCDPGHEALPPAVVTPIQHLPVGRERATEVRPASASDARMSDGSSSPVALADVDAAEIRGEAPLDPWPQNAPRPRAVSLVRSLSHAMGELTSVPDVAGVVLAEAMTQVDADAGAILVRDGFSWRVVAGDHLRPLEHRARLGSDHWLVQEVSQGWHGVLLTGGEGDSSQLYGAPLSYRPFLLAMPLPPVGAILMLASDEASFTGQDLQRLQGLSDEAGHLLSDALDVRKLARLLRPFCDDED
jgi:hypothetical protein